MSALQLLGTSALTHQKSNRHFSTSTLRTTGLFILLLSGVDLRSLHSNLRSLCTSLPVQAVPKSPPCLKGHAHMDVEKYLLSQLVHCSAAKYCSVILAMPSLIFICGFCKASCGMQIIPVCLQVCAKEEILGA